MAKTYVLDTNVLLHDPEALLQFEDNDVVIPLAVIVELDGLKRGHGEIQVSARRTLRLIDSFRKKGNVSARVELPGGGKLRVDTGDRGIDTAGQNADNSIILTGVRLKVNNPDPVVMVSKDTAVRIKAETLGVSAQDYRSDKSTIFQACGKILAEEANGEDINSVRYRTDGRGAETLPGVAGLVFPGGTGGVYGRCRPQHRAGVRPRRPYLRGY